MALVSRLILPLVLVLATRAAPPAGPAQQASLPEAGAWVWPIEGPVIRAFDPPETPFGSGHRGIDIAAAVETVVVAAEAGTVSFAGPVGGELFVTIDHGGGLSSTYSWVSAILVRVGDQVARGSPIASSGAGHPRSAIPHLHFGVRLDGAYLDPLELLGQISVSAFVRLAPLAGEAA